MMRYAAVGHSYADGASINVYCGKTARSTRRTVTTILRKPTDVYYITKCSTLNVVTLPSWTSTIIASLNYGVILLIHGATHVSL